MVALFNLGQGQGPNIQNLIAPYFIEVRLGFIRLYPEVDFILNALKLKVTTIE